MTEAETVLMDFFKAMNDWEIKSYELAKEKEIDSIKDQIKPSLTRIYETYLAKPAGRTGRMAGPDVGFPPEYDSSCESIVSLDEISKNKVFIETKWVHPANTEYSQRQRYTLLKINGEWKINKKEKYREFDGKWNNIVF